jgi:hypothetical protein
MPPPTTALAFRLAATAAAAGSSTGSLGPSSALRSVAALAFARGPTTGSRTYTRSATRLASLPPKTALIQPSNQAEVAIQPPAASHYPDSYTGPTHLVGQLPKAGYGEVGKGWTGKDYSKGPSALDKAAELFFFTECVLSWLYVGGWAHRIEGAR